MTSGIYVITNTLTGEQYIGASGNIEKRWEQHQRQLEMGKHNVLFQEAWNTHGSEAFCFDVLEEVEDGIDLGERERYYMERRYQTTGGDGYNVAPGGLGQPRSTDNQVINMSTSSELMERIRKAVKQRAGTIAGFVRQAIEEKLEREGV